eukprot:Tbor_TRINITY_DN2920_c0_g1::TRINITY_DN2920_c0_g1_i1::g.1201::m.1201
MHKISPLSLKTGVNTRTPLSERLEPIQSKPVDVFKSYSYKKGMDSSTYSQASVGSYVQSATDIPKREKEPGLGVTMDLSERTKYSVKTAGLNSTYGAVEIGCDPTFFSRIRRIEREDDAIRHGLETIRTRSGASQMQRTVDIMRKRETHPDFNPPKEKFSTIQRRSLNGVPHATALEKVRFTYEMPNSSHQNDFRIPMGYLPLELDQCNNVQRRIISETASGKAMFTGTPKSRADVLPGYMAHVPSNISNFRQIQGDADVLRAYSRSGISIGAPSTSKPQRPLKDRLLTIQGNALEQAMYSTEEKGLNKVKFGIKTAVFN